MNTNSIELLNDAGSEYTAGTKLHFKIRMKAKDYKGEQERRSGGTVSTYLCCVLCACSDAIYVVLDLRRINFLHVHCC